MKWTFTNSGFLTGEENMSLDFAHAESLITALQHKTSPFGHFRVYGWDKPTLSLGKNQLLSQEIETNCSIQDIPIVRRPTGGRAVLHANELTYCIIMPCESMETARKAYASIHAFFLNALQSIGMSKLDFVKSHADFHEHYSNLESSSCFSSSARYELTCNGKKLMGSAQRVMHGVLLQHGSLPLDTSYLDIVTLLTAHQSEQKRIRERIISHSTCLSECHVHSYEFSEIASAIESTWMQMKGTFEL